MKVTLSSDSFLKGLVFGFDVGTGSIGYAVRKGADFKDVGVLICESEGSDLRQRRDLRRQRRTLRSRKYRRQWFAKELMNLGLPRPEQPPHDPISLRLRALNGDPLKPEELHAALAHLFKRRGYSKVPWANVEKTAKENAKPKKNDEEGEIKKAVEGIRKEMDEKKCEFPCQLLEARRKEAGTSPDKEWGRKIYWPRDLLEKELRAIAAAQKERFPALIEKADWLLYGDAKEVKGHRVFFKTTEARNPGVLGVRWPRFDNRGPALDSLQPVDEQGRPLHVVRKNKEAFTKAQWELALMNFRVLDAKTRQRIDPRIHFPIFIENLRNEWNKRGKVTEARLKKLAEPFADKFLLIEDQKPLTPETGAGRARYSSPTLELIRKRIDEGGRVDPPQPVLRREGEIAEQALNRYLADIRHPLVRHRLVLFRGILRQLVKDYGQPNMIVLEAVRSLAMDKKSEKYKEMLRRNEIFRKDRVDAREELSANQESTSRRAIQRYRLWKEAKGRCPFCLETIARTDLGHRADIEHIVPRALVDCSEWYNLTVAHLKCNRELKGNQTPFAAFANTANWEAIKKNAEDCFKNAHLNRDCTKADFFVSPQAEEMIEQKSDIQHTAYIARLIRHVSLIQLGWLNDQGRDPTPEKQNPALSFQVTNGQLTSRLRKAWGLNQILHPLPPGMKWEDLSEEEQKQFTEKNRGDLRHHALDAMVIACTLPWLAHRTHGATDELGNHGWWTQDEKQRSKTANPIFGDQMHDMVKREIASVVVRPHVSRSNHGKKLDTTPLSLRVIEGKKEVFVARRPLREKSPESIRDIFSAHLKNYIATEWASWAEANPDWDKENKGPNKGRFPERFIRQLVDPIWKKPVRSVKFIVERSRSSVFKVGVHPSGNRRDIFVAYGENKEVRVYKLATGSGFVAQAIRPCYANGESPARPPQAGELAFVVRRGTLFRLNNAFKIGKQELPPGIYKVVALPGEADGRVSFFPHFQSTSSKDGKRLQPIRADIEKIAAHIDMLSNKGTRELPHPPSVKPQPESPHQA
jgi:hypothetical protein